MRRLVVTLVDRAELTVKEADVLCLLCEGLLRKEIAFRVRRSAGTVAKHLEHIAVKLDAHSAAEIVAKAVANHMVDISIRCWLLALVCNCFAVDEFDVDMRRPPATPRPPVTRHHSKNNTPRFQRDS